MSLKLIAKKTHIVHKDIQGNGKTSYTIEKGQIFTIFVKHITKYDKDGELVVKHYCALGTEPMFAVSLKYI